MDSPHIDELNLLHANICQALGDIKRIQILYALYAQERHVTDLAALLDIPQPTVSRHLSVLRQRSLVVAERRGPLVVYSLAEPRIIEVLNSMRQILRDSLEKQAAALNGVQPPTK